ncbi:MAG: hypothetical protein ACTHOE_06850 [Conexibacter sp.]
MLALICASAVMAGLAGTASARNLSINRSNITAVWREMTFTASGLSIRCPVTLSGSIHSSTIAKVAGSLIGYINSATVGTASCSGGSARANTETLPWHVRYRSFSGTLPNITSINTDIVGATFEITTVCGTARYSGTAGGAFNREARGGVTSVSASGTVSRVGGSSFCPASGTLSGSSGSIGATVTLI